jgi:hypothetical protein
MSLFSHVGPRNYSELALSCRSGLALVTNGRVEPDDSLHARSLDRTTVKELQP